MDQQINRQTPFSLIGFFLLFCFSQLSGQNCSIAEDIILEEDGITDICFTISKATNNDLGDNQNLCIVELSFTIDTVSNLQVQIISPTGQFINLTGPTNSNQLNSTQSIEWSIVFAASNYSALADNGFPDKWNNDNSWESNTSYSGRYYPFEGKLDGFIGSVNGQWIVRIDNTKTLAKGVINYLGIKFCDPAGIECNVTVGCDGIVGIDLIQSFHEQQIKIYPNPFTNQLFIETNLENLDFTLYNIHRKKLKQTRNVNNLELEQLQEGLYLLQIRDEESGHQIIERIVKSSK